MANDKPFKINNGLSAKRYLLSSVAVAASDVDLSTGSYFSKALSADTTFTFSNPPTSGKAMGFALEITGGSGTTGYSISQGSYDSIQLATSSQDGTANAFFFKVINRLFRLCIRILEEFCN